MPRFQDLWLVPSPDQLDDRVWPEMLLITLWRIWDSRNAVVFRSQDHTPDPTIRNIVTDLELFSHRFRDPVDKVAATSWLSYLAARLAVPL